MSEQRTVLEVLEELEAGQIEQDEKLDQILENQAEILEKLDNLGLPGDGYSLIEP